MSMMRCEKHGAWDSDMMTYCPGCEPDCQYCDDTDPLCPVKLQNAAKPASSDLIAPDLVARLNDMLLIGLSNVTMAFAAQLIREAAATLRTLQQERIAEIDQQWRNWGTIEVAIRNPSVAEFMRHWEGRATKAEAALRRVAITCVTANPDVLHHSKCACCGGRWSGRPTMPEQHIGDCPAAIVGGDRG